MQHVLFKLNVERDQLAQDLFPVFKQHLRVLHDHEDDMILMYLLGAIDAIATYSDNDINLTEYRVFYPKTLDYRSPSNLYGWYCGKQNVTGMQILDSTNHDVVANFEVDYESGMVYPHPFGHEIIFDSGYGDVDSMPPRLVNIIFRLGAEYMEMKESSRVGEPKHLPEWINFALASVWSPRV